MDTECKPNYDRGMKISGKQIRAARALTGLTQRQLATAAGLSLATVNNFERQEIDLRMSTADRMQSALESVGVEFLADDGVRLRQSSSIP